MKPEARQRKANHPLFEFERSGKPSARQPAGHQPDLDNLSVIQKGNTSSSNYSRSNYSRNRSNSNTSASLDFIELPSLPTKAPPQVSSSYNNNFFSNSRNQNKRYPFNNNGRIFDTLFMVDLLNTTKFDKVTEINASSQNLNAIDIESLKQLRFVKKADFSDNSLPLEPFSVLPELEELDMSCNGLKKFDFDKCEKEYMDLDDDGRAWNSLHTLNLSHNMGSNMIADLQLIPLLSNLNLSSNSISNLPSNLMYFTCLTTLDLSNNSLNSDSSLFSLATIPSLQVLNLDYNGLIRIPKFQYGFEALNKISLRSNHFEESDDFDSLADLLSLQEVNIMGNPIVIRGSKYLAQAKKIFANAKIDLICDAPAQPLKTTLSGNVRKVPLDPLTLPFHSRAHKRALNDGFDRRQPVRGSQKVPPLDINPNSNNDNTHSNDDDVFMTSFISKVDENKSKNKPNENDQFNKNSKNEMFQRIETQMKMNINPDIEEELSYRIPAIPAALIPSYEEDEPVRTNFWSEIPVVQDDKRLAINKQVSRNYNRAFNQLQFIVLHPESKPGNVGIKKPVKLNDINKKPSIEIIEDQDAYINGTCYNNEDSVFTSDFNGEYQEGQEIDEIQDIIDKRNEDLRQEKNKNELRNRKRITPIPTARRSDRSDYYDDDIINYDQAQKITKEEIEGIIQNMDDKLVSVERDMQAADDERMAEERKRLKEKCKRKSRRNKKEKGVDGENYYGYDDSDSDDDEYETGDRFAKLNKQYESIRANLLKILS